MLANADERCILAIMEQKNPFYFTDTPVYKIVF